MIIGGNDDDCENLCGGSLPQTFLAHSKVSDLYVPLLENIKYNNYANVNDREIDDVNDYLVKHDIVQLEVSVDDSMLRKKRK